MVDHLHPIIIVHTISDSMDKHLTATVQQTVRQLLTQQISIPMHQRQTRYLTVQSTLGPTWLKTCAVLILYPKMNISSTIRRLLLLTGWIQPIMQWSRERNTITTILCVSWIVLWNKNWIKAKLMSLTEHLERMPKVSFVLNNFFLF